MATLYDINFAIDQLLESNLQADEEVIDGETGIIDTVANTLDRLDIDFKDKVDNIGCFIKNLNADIDAIKNEEKKLAERRKVKENLVERLKNYLTDNLTIAGYSKFETARCALSFRKSKQVEINENVRLPEAFIQTKVVEQPDKKALKEAIENGMLIDGVSIVEKSNIQIK